MTEFLLHTLIMVSIYIILAVSCNLILGYAGILQIGHGAFYAIGAYTGALIALKLQWPFAVEVIASGVLAAVLGVVLTASLVRVGHDYVALGTFSFAIVIHTVLRNWDSLTRGSLGLVGIPPIELFSLRISRGFEFLVVAAVFMVITLLVSVALVNSPFGRALKALREDEIAVLATGRSILRLKTLAFGIGVFFAGIAGNLYAHYATFIDPSSFTIHPSILILAMIVLGGTGTLLGPVVGALVLVLVPEALRFVGLPATTGGLIRQGIYGSLLVIMLLYKPDGLMGRRASIRK